MALVGARGASETITRSAKSDGSTGYLSNASNLGASDSKAFTAVFSYWVNTVSGGDTVLFATAGSDDFKIVFDNGQIQLIGRNTAGSAILFATTTTSITGEVFGTIMLSIDLSNTSNRHIYNNGVAMPTTWSSYTNDFIKFASMTNYWSFANNGGSPDLNGNLCGLYFTTDYIDFSQEVNRNLFVNQLGYPRDLTPEIEAGNIPTPLFYLKFDDTSNLGLDSSGNNNHFTTVGTVTAGADFNI